MPPFEIITAEAVEWAKKYDGPLFHALLADAPYHLTSIAKRFGKPDAAPAKHGKDGAFARASAGFMGQTWDGGDIAFRPETWAAFLPVLHPGAFGMAFAGSRGWHRLAVAIEDAGFIIHPSIFGWVYASGFPKATRIDTQIDRAAGAERPVVGVSTIGGGGASGGYEEGWTAEGKGGMAVKGAATDLAKTWEHHRYGGQAVKPALEPIIVFQKPYEGRPIDDIARTGAGALNIDGARIEGPGGNGVWGTSNKTTDPERKFSGSPDKAAYRSEQHAGGRWPANFALAHHPDCFIIGQTSVKTNVATGGESKAGQIFGYGNDRGPEARGHSVDGLETVERWACVPECPVRRLNDQAGRLSSGQGTVVRKRSDTGYSGGWPGGEGELYGDAGYASRFFFTAVEAALTEADVVQYEEKADVEERERGLRGVFRCLMDGKPGVRHDVDTLWSESHFVIREDGPEIEVACRRNPHPTVKPIDLVRWLATLLLPPDAYAPRRLLVPFAGVGSEVIGARQAGWEEIVGVELHERYAAIGRQRLAAHLGMF